MTDSITTIIPLILLIYKVVLGLSVVISTLLSLHTGILTRRLRNRMISWSDRRHLRHLRVPAFALILTVMATAVLAYHLYTGTYTYIYYELAYLWLGITWGVTYRWMSKRYITDHGIVKNVLVPSQTISWTQIVDYVERTFPNHSEYTFLYQGQQPDERTLQRLTLEVPQALDTRFKNILLYKLDRPFEMATQWSASKQPLR